jgi:hypothetical protein
LQRFNVLVESWCTGTFSCAMCQEFVAVNIYQKRSFKLLITSLNVLLLLETKWRFSTMYYIVHVVFSAIILDSVFYVKYI